MLDPRFSYEHFAACMTGATERTQSLAVALTQRRPELALRLSYPEKEPRSVAVEFALQPRGNAG